MDLDRGNSSLDATGPPVGRSVFSLRVGALLLILAGVGWMVVPFVPWLMPSRSLKIAVVGGILVGAEILFWCGLALAGRGTWRLAREQGWRRVPQTLWHVVLKGHLDESERSPS